MIVGVVLSVLATFISVFSLTCLTMNSMADSTKAKMSLTAGIMFIIAGRVRNNIRKFIWELVERIFYPPNPSPFYFFLKGNCTYFTY